MPLYNVIHRRLSAWLSGEGDSYFCASESFCRIWPRHLWPGCGILTEMSFRARRNHRRPENRNMNETWQKKTDMKHNSLLVLLCVTLTPATRTPSADFTTFLKKSSSFSFLFFPRTLSCQTREVKGHSTTTTTYFFPLYDPIISSLENFRAPP